MMPSQHTIIIISLYISRHAIVRWGSPADLPIAIHRVQFHIYFWCVLGVYAVWANYSRVSTGKGPGARY